MKNNIADLNNILFEQIELLMDDSDDVDFEKEIRRSKAVVDVSKSILEVGRLQLEVMRIADTCNYTQKEMPELLTDKRKDGIKRLEER